MKGFALLLTLSIGIVLTLGADPLRECDGRDWIAAYTQCHQDKRDLVYYWKPNLNCTIGSVSLPQNSYNLQCDIPCGEGTYLPLGGTTCEPCAPGTFSIGGGERVTDWVGNNWGDLNWATWCMTSNGTFVTNTTQCPGWAPGGGGIFITSGASVTNNQQSALLLGVTLVADGHVHFQYRVDSEPNYDKMIFQINGETLISTSNTVDYETFKMNLTKGFYELFWVYKKDYSISQGEDAAFIKMFEIGGTTFADDACTPCGRGQYNNEDKMEECFDCPANTYANVTGTTECLPCDDSEYSFPGSIECTTRLPCTVNDFGVVYSECQNGVRTRSSVWYQPIICDTATYALPPPFPNLPCEQCNPGTYRNQNTWKCVPCADGTARGLGDATCQGCGAGTAAVKGFQYLEWTEWPSELTTSCEGSCGTDGYRMMGDYIDSGIGHGVSVDVFLNTVVTLKNMTGQVSFNFSLICQSDCHVDFIDEGYQTQIFTTGTRRVVTYNLAWDPNRNGTLGEHSLSWNFHGADADLTGRNDRVQIHWIKIFGTVEGGAANCSTCLAGTYSQNSAAVCSLCPPGQSSANNSATCSNCPANTFNDQWGQVCLPCGHGTTSVPGSVNCSSNCSYAVDVPFNGESYQVVYDVSALRRTDEMYGPIYDDDYDDNKMVYYLNVCSKEHHNHTCFDRGGHAIASYSCQITTQGYGVDLGRVLGFYDYEPNPGAGFIMSYTQGTRCGTTGRSTNITFLCDPNEGVGQPVGAVPIEDTACRYNFIWNSTYGCPLCSSLHYGTFYSPCNDGYQYKVYYWRTNPKTCHGGVDLPPRERITCFSSNTTCLPGQFATPGANNCSDCPPGSYSRRGGVDFLSWEEIPEGFSTYCTSSSECEGWIANNHSVDSSPTPGASSYLSYNIILSSASTLEFTYRMIPDAELQTTFNVRMDGNVVYSSLNLTLEYTTVSINVPTGNHTFMWELVQIIPSPFKPHVSINSISFNSNTFASTSCTICPAGTYASLNRSTQCQTCHPNYYSGSGAPDCGQCDDDEYSITGSDHCKSRPTCTAYDYQIFYTQCKPDGAGSYNRVQYQRLIEPAVCIVTFTPANSTVPCADCPFGSWREIDGSCSSCSTGYWNGTACVPATPGHYIVKKTLYFINSEDGWPSGWGTSCSGVCSTDGWRIRGNEIDSGDHTFDQDGEVDSYVYLDVHLAIEGRVEFVYTDPSLIAPEMSFQFFIDGVSQPFTSSGKSANYISAGNHRLLWNLYQPNGVRGIASLSKVEIYGVTTGIAEWEPCPPGHYSLHASATSCTPCDVGSYSLGGHPNCTLCPIGTYADHTASVECKTCLSAPPVLGQSTCNNTCIFAVNSTLAYSLAMISDTIPIISAYGDWFINPCKTIYETECSKNGVPIETSICLVDKSGVAHDNGNTAVFQSYTDEAIIAKGFYLSFESGDPCEYMFNTPRRTTIQFVCDPDALQRPALSPIFTNATLCNANFVWPSMYGCPVCNQDDYVTTVGECVDGQQNSIDTRVNDCNGPKTKNEALTSCSTTFTFPIALVIASGIAFVALLSVAIFVFVKNRRIVHQYNRLQESFNSRGQPSSGGQVELDNFDKPSPANSKSFTIEDEQL